LNINISTKNEIGCPPPFVFDETVGLQHSFSYLFVFVALCSYSAKCGIAIKLGQNLAPEVCGVFASRAL